MKRTVETSSPAVTRRQKRLSGLTAATLLQYCTNILSPSQSIDKKTKTNNKRSRRSNNTSPAPRTSPKKAKVSFLSFAWDIFENQNFPYDLHFF